MVDFEMSFFCPPKSPIPNKIIAVVPKAPLLLIPPLTLPLDPPPIILKKTKNEKNKSRANFNMETKQSKEKKVCNLYPFS